ncbi:MAG: hypothetical protein H6960_11725 [Chromatiaceae bacterium]|nr:hypothetical protein [Chromatiaceae bacterium]
MPILKHGKLILLVALLVTAFVYAGGLNGPFLFDDHIHITQNRWVKIDSLSWPDMTQAWQSSFSAFPSNRPLAQLSFGINHALSGLDPWAFKTTNLAIHLLSGLLVFVFIRLVLRALAGDTTLSQRDTFVAAAVAAVWLLHPMHVSTVLYAVQRMTGLSTLFTLAALSSYFWGRIRIAEGGRVPCGFSAPSSGCTGLSCRNRCPAAVVVAGQRTDGTAWVSAGHQRRFVHAAWILMIALPCCRHSVFLHHPACSGYDAPVFRGGTRPPRRAYSGCMCGGCSSGHLRIRSVPTTSLCPQADQPNLHPDLGGCIAGHHAGRTAGTGACRFSLSRCCFSRRPLHSNRACSRWRWCSNTATTCPVSGRCFSLPIW